MLNRLRNIILFHVWRRRSRRRYRDHGGPLQPGLTPVLNRTGRPEYIQRPEGAE